MPARSDASAHIVVLGAGAFGGWTAWHLGQAGHRVTLVDPWGPGNARASSGGDTRVLRHAYGNDLVYIDLAARSLVLFRECEQRWNTPLFERTGLLWMVQDDEQYELACLESLNSAGIPHQRLSVDDLQRRWPQLGLDGVRWAFFEEAAGVLLARRSCAAVFAAFVSAGGTSVPSAARPGPIRSGSMDGVLLADGTSLHADAYVFACGPWLGQLFPDLLSEPLVRPTRQEVFTFGTPAGDSLHQPPQLPVWSDHGPTFWYGIPGNEGRGFKLGDDTRGAEFDPTQGEREPSAAGLAAARDYLALRFPAMKDAPLLEARVCQYAMSPDGDFFLDRHPEASNLWLMGGGSGHGFKHGPALGELAAGCVTGTREPEPHFSLERFA